MITYWVETDFKYRCSMNVNRCSALRFSVEKAEMAGGWNAPKWSSGKVEVRRREAASALPGSRDFKSPPEISCGTVPCSDQATHPPFLWMLAFALIVHFIQSNNICPICQQQWNGMILEDVSISSRHHDPHHLCEAGAGGPGPCYHQGLQCPAQGHLQDSFWGQWTASHPGRCQVPKICWDRQSQTAWWHSQVNHCSNAGCFSDHHKYKSPYPRAGQVLEVSGNKAVVQVR